MMSQQREFPPQFFISIWLHSLLKVSLTNCQLDVCFSAALALFIQVLINLIGQHSSAVLTTSVVTQNSPVVFHKHLNK